MAVGVVADLAASVLLEGLDAVREQPAPAGGVPARLAVLARATQELHGVYLRELARADLAGEPAAAGCRGTADLLVQAAGLPVWQARADAALSRRLAPLPGLLDALAGGGLELAAARELARAWAVLPPGLRDAATAAALIDLAGLVDLPDLRAKVDELRTALQPDVDDDSLAAAHESGELVLVDVGAETRLSGHTDALTGEWLREVLGAKAQADRGLLDSRTDGARLLDALVELVRTASQGDAVPGGSAVPTLVVIATAEDLERTSEVAPDVVPPADALADLLAPLQDRVAAHAPDPASPVGSTDAGGSTVPSAPRWSARSRGGVRLGPRTLSRISCDAALTRLLVDARGWPLDSSPLARQLSRRECRALEHRAGYRCQRTGCGRPAAVCVPHHVVPFALGGPSTQANTVLLCRSCHHQLHDQQHPLDLTDGSRIGPRGWLRPPPGAPPPQLF